MVTTYVERGLLSCSGDDARLAGHAMEQDFLEATQQALLQKLHSVLCVKLSKLSMLQQLVRFSTSVQCSCDDRMTVRSNTPAFAYPSS